MQTSLSRQSKKSWISTSIKEKLIHGFFFFNGMFSVVVLLGIFSLLVFTSIPAFREINIGGFLFGTNWNPTSYVKEEYGIIPMLVSTLMVTLVGVAVVVSLGMLSNMVNYNFYSINNQLQEALTIPNDGGGYSF